MFLVLTVMFTGACAGLFALFLISGDLARRCGLAGPGRLLLSAGLGLGVLAISVKLLLVGILMQATNGGHHPVHRSTVIAGPANVPPRHDESSHTGRWLALPATAPTPDGTAPGEDVIRLGKRLFNEAGLSADGAIACSSCHKLDAGGDDDAVVPTGVNGLRGNRNAPTVANAAFLSRLFWDGRAGSLEEQARGPLTNPREMGMPSHAAVEAAVRRLAGYSEEFARAFGTRDSITIDNIAFAIASYERTLVFPDTDYDRFVGGEPNALTPVQIRGMALFAGLGCRMCHRDPTFSAAGKIKPAGVRKPFPVFAGNRYVREYGLLADRGSRGEGDPGRPGLWRVPSLRNVAETAPYFHNGSVKTLEEAVRVMAVTQLGWRIDMAQRSEMPDLAWDPDARKLTPYRPRVLSGSDIEALAAFLRSLSNANGQGVSGARSAGGG